MAAVNTLEVTPTVTGLPPRPNHVIPKFHNRSNLFPSTCSNKLYEEKPPCSANRQAWSADARNRKPATDIISSKTVDKNGCKNENRNDNGLKKNKLLRRPISAKARLESTATDLASNKPVNQCKDLVPANGKDVPVVDIGDNAPFPTYHFMFNSKEKYVSADTKPFLPGLKDSRVPPVDLFQTSDPPTTTTAPEIKPVVYGLNSHQVVFGTDFEEEVHNIKYDLTEHKTKEKVERPLPSTLEPLRQWLSDKSSIPGVNDALIFLPSLENYNDLPEVPSPHSVHDDLPFKEKLPQQKTTTKKYHHPAFDKKHVEDWVCNHSRPGTVNGRVDHQNYQPLYRSVGEIRTEITELENLMQGLGNIDSDCGMVKFQGEIDRFRKMFEDTMKMVPERLLHSPKDPDTFGVKEFLKQHVDIMNEVRRKHTLCLEELRLIEAEAGIDSSRKYFKHRTFPPDT